MRFWRIVLSTPIHQPSCFLPFDVRAVLVVRDQLRLRALFKANGAHIRYAVFWNGLRTNALPIDPRISLHSPPLDRAYNVAPAWKVGGLGYNSSYFVRRI